MSLVWKFWPAAVALAAEAASFTSLVSYVALLVVHLDGNMDRSSAGWYSGLIVGVYQATQIVASRWFGALSDRHGRRPVVIWGMVAGLVINLLFGVCTTLLQALVCRAVMGLVNGNNVVLKAVCGDLAREAEELELMRQRDEEASAPIGQGARNNNSVSGSGASSAEKKKGAKNVGAKLFSVMNGAWSCGSLLGPVAGGVLYGRVWPAYPALLPMVVCVAYSALSLVAVMLWMPETNRDLLLRAQEQQKRQQQQQQEQKNIRDDEIVRMKDGGIVEDGGEGLELQQQRGQLKQDDDADQVPQQKKDEPAPVTKRNTNFGYCDMLRPQHRVLLRVILAYIVCCGTNITTTECLPLLCLLPREFGGFGWEAHHIGTLFAVQAGFALLCATYIQPLCDAFGRLTVMRYSFFLWAMTLPLFVTAASVTSTWHMLLMLLVLVIVRTSAATIAFTLSTSAIASTAPRDALGAVTGVSHSSGNVSRAVFPILATPLFAWSVANIATSTRAAHNNTHLNDTLFFNSNNSSRNYTAASSSYAPTVVQLKSFPFNAYCVFVLNSFLCLLGPLCLHGLTPESISPVAPAAKEKSDEQTAQIATQVESQPAAAASAAIPVATAVVVDDDVAVVSVATEPVLMMDDALPVALSEAVEQ